MTKGKYIRICKTIIRCYGIRSSVHRSYFDGVVGSKVKGIISQELSESGNRTSIDTDDSS